MAQLSGTRVLVTGGTSGLGRAMAEALVDAGAHVALTSREAGRARATASELGMGAVSIELDVRDPSSVAAAVDDAFGSLGGLDLLVNNAGIGMRTVNPRFMTEPQPFWEVTPAGFREVLETKATGTFLVAREVVPRMLDAGGGRVVTISMSEQTMVRRGFVPYGPSGAAVEALARVMAADLAETPVTANILLPGGATATGMVPDDVTDEVRGNLLDPSIMGPPIVWLASADAAGVHDERIVASDFGHWLAARQSTGTSSRLEAARLAFGTMVTIKIGEQIYTTEENLAEVEASVMKALQGDHVGRVQLTNGAALYLNTSMAVQVMDTQSR